jgi:hypothetical protein
MCYIYINDEDTADSDIPDLTPNKQLDWEELGRTDTSSSDHLALPKEINDPFPDKPSLIPFRYGCLHDLESIWWIAIWWIFSHIPGDSTATQEHISTTQKLF